MKTLNVLFVSERVNETRFPADNPNAFRCIFAAEAETAIEKMQSIDFDIALIDTALPEEEAMRLKTLFSVQQPDTHIVPMPDTDDATETLARIADGIKARNRSKYRFTDNIFPN